MGAVKEGWEEICKRLGGQPISEDELELLAIDAEQAAQRYRDALGKKRDADEPR